MPTPNPYNSDVYINLYQLYNEQKYIEYFKGLEELALQNYPFALTDLAQYYFYRDEIEDNLPIKADKTYAQLLMKRCIDLLKQDEAKGNGEASRLLGYVYCRLIGIEEPDLVKAEYHLLKAIELEHYFAANDLVTFYLHTDKVKAQYYYNLAKQHGECIITDPTSDIGRMTSPLEDSPTSHSC